MDVLRGEPLLPLSDERFTVLEAQGRVLYPVLKQEPVRGIIRGLLDLEAPRRVTVYFLFAGDQPLDLSAFTPYEQGVRVRPVVDSNAHRRMLDEWWQQYSKRYQQLLKNGEYPPLAENFLVATLARRLKLTMPPPKSSLFGRSSDRENPFDYLLVNEAHRMRIDRELLQDPSGPFDELIELPAREAWTAEAEVADGLPEVAVETLANYVPSECFYVRFGSFSNYLWLRELNQKWQGDLGNMIMRRGLTRGSSKRIQQQLSLKYNALAKIFGPKVIEDAALVGMDPYMDQGAGIGLLFQAKNEVLLAADLLNQRRASLAKFEDATEETFEIEGKSVSLISNPTGEVRSYHTNRDGVHLVSTSRTLVERFLQAGQGKGSLAELTSFRRARQTYPLDREDTMFAFVSELFWQNLCTPSYVIENYRRMRSVRESAVLELAGFAAQGEARANGNADELDLASVLPASFGYRPDGSELLIAEDNRHDSQRGAVGFFVPVSDVQVENATAHEIAIYRRTIQAVRASVAQMPPIVAAIKRNPPVEQGGDEKISVDVRAYGSLREALGKLGNWIGQPSDTRLMPVEGDLLAGEAVVSFPGLTGENDGGDQHLFGALRDFRSPLVVRRGAVRPDAPPAELVRGYLGAWPNAGLLSWFTGGEVAQGPEPQAVGADIWQAKREEFLLLSFKPEVVNQVLPQLQKVPAERPAQAWLSLQDLTGTQLAETVNALGYMRTRDASAAGTRVMNSLANQLGVPRHQCKEVAERLIDGTFACPLGGEYQLYEPDRGLEVWVSSSMPAANRFLLTEVPDDFQLPLLEWFRGLNAEMSLDDSSLSLHLELEMSEAAMP
ncbi:MAG: hypothetical protein AAGD11_02550 [Planctomycetota bacterium]